MLMEEIWKDIEGFEGLYQVSNLGRVKALEITRLVKSVRRRNNVVKDEYWDRRERILKPIPVNGLDTVHLYNLNHERTTVAIKRLVALHFMKEAIDYNNHVARLKTSAIRYRDGDRTNCCVDNLYLKIID